MVLYECIYNDKKDVSRIGYTDITEVTEKIEHLNSVHLKKTDGTIEGQITETKTKARDDGAVELDDGWVTADRKSPLIFSATGFRSRN
jgi:hypothetical protein